MVLRLRQQRRGTLDKSMRLGNLLQPIVEHQAGILRNCSPDRNAARSGCVGALRKWLALARSCGSTRAHSPCRTGAIQTVSCRLQAVRSPRGGSQSSDCCTPTSFQTADSVDHLGAGRAPPSAAAASAPRPAAFLLHPNTLARYRHKETALPVSVRPSSGTLRDWPGPPVTLPCGSIFSISSRAGNLAGISRRRLDQARCPAYRAVFKHESEKLPQSRSATFPSTNTRSASSR